MRSILLLSLLIVSTLADKKSTIVIFGGIQYTGESATFTITDFKGAAAGNEHVSGDSHFGIPDSISSYRLGEGLIATFCYTWTP